MIWWADRRRPPDTNSQKSEIAKHFSSFQGTQEAVTVVSGEIGKQDYFTFFERWFEN